MSDALRGLDAVPWKTLKHAYGAATDVPQTLRGLVGDGETRKRAWSKLRSTIWHQGTRFSATAHAVPFLIRLVEDRATPGRAALLVYLVDLAWGFADEALAEPLAPISFGRGAFRATYEAVAAGTPRYLALLDDDDPRVRAAAAYAAPWFESTAKRVVDDVRTRLAREDDVVARASMTLALGMAARRCREREPFAQALRDRDELVRACAACALAWADENQASSRALEPLVGQAQLRKTALPWNRGDLAGLAGILLAARAKGSTSGMIALARGLATIEDPLRALQAAIALLAATGLAKLPREPVMLQSLNDAQREALTLLSEHAPSFHFANIGAHLDAHGLPASRDGLQRWLGIAAATSPWERHVEVVTRDGPRSWPLEVCLRAVGPKGIYAWHPERAIEPDALVSALRAQLAPDELVECAARLAKSARGFDRDSNEPRAIAMALLEGFEADAAPLLRERGVS